MSVALETKHFALSTQFDETITLATNHHRSLLPYSGGVHIPARPGDKQFSALHPCDSVTIKRGDGDRIPAAANRNNYTHTN
jgi:hypothetical protein